MEQSYDVFISYSRKDYVDEHKNVIPGNEVSKIKEALTEAGITFWFDEEGVYSGDEFAKKIVHSIKASKIFVFLSTVNSNQSEWTANEISTAHMLNKRILPVRIDDSVYHDDVILYISRLSHVDYNDNPEKGRRELVRSINAYLDEAKLVEAKKIADEKRRQEELERQRQKQEEERRRQEQITKIEAEVAALESQRTERKKVVLQKEQELKLAQVDLDECEAKILKLQIKIQDLREPKAIEQKRKEDERKAAEEKCLVEEKRREEKSNVKEKTFSVGNVSFKMIRVEGGDMGTFYIGETLVTQALWQAVMGNNPSQFKGQDYPVESVSWNDICGMNGTGTDLDSFLCRLRKKTGRTFRLPNEVEWEFAAKGGNKSKGYTYAGGNDVNDVAWFWENSRRSTHPVKTKSPNELGIYDMSGNVWEWCENLYLNSGPGRVVRGGGWNDYAMDCQLSDRDYYDSDRRINGIGFRLVLSS